MPLNPLESQLFDIAKECYQRGPGYSQEGVVLRQAAESLISNLELAEQQRVLTAWQNLFREGLLAWGYNIDNPSSPFFHIVEQ